MGSLFQTKRVLQTWMLVSITLGPACLAQNIDFDRPLADQLPRPITNPRSMEECNSLSSAWANITDQIRAEHQSCLDSYSGMKNISSGRECSVLQCEQLHQLMNNPQLLAIRDSQIALCRTRAPDQPSTRLSTSGPRNYPGGRANGQTDRDFRELISETGVKGSEWEEHVNWALYQLHSCNTKADDSTACSLFVNNALQKVYAVDDFSRLPLANQIFDYVITHDDSWIEIGRANDQQVLRKSQEMANRGYAVIAIRPDKDSRCNDCGGHVALIIPGRLKESANWGSWVPNSANMVVNKPSASYIGKRLSFAFAPNKRHDVMIYYRKMTLR